MLSDFAFADVIGIRPQLAWRCTAGRDAGLSPSFGSTGGLYAAVAIQLLQRFYFQGNPRGAALPIPTVGSPNAQLSGLLAA